MLMYHLMDSLLRDSWKRQRDLSSSGQVSLSVFHVCRIVSVCREREITMLNIECFSQPASLITFKRQMSNLGNI